MGAPFHAVPSDYKYFISVNSGLSRMHTSPTDKAPVMSFLNKQIQGCDPIMNSTLRKLYLRRPHIIIIKLNLSKPSHKPLCMTLLTSQLQLNKKIVMEFPLKGKLGVTIP